MRKLAILTAVLLAAVALVGCTPSAGSTSGPRASAVAEKTAEPVAVDNVLGKPYSDASNALLREGFVVKLDAPDGNAESHSDFYEVVTQDPEAGAEVAVGSTVTLHIKPIPIPVPKVVGQDYSSAKSAIEASIGDFTATSAQDDGLADNWIVKAQSPAGGASAVAGTAIKLTLAQPQVVFTITGNGSTSNVITYTIPSSLNIEQAASARLPWSKSFPYTGGGLMPNGNISAQDYDGTSITCTITVAGRVVDKQTATGPYAIVQCGG